MSAKDFKLNIVTSYIEHHANLDHVSYHMEFPSEQ